MTSLLIAPPHLPESNDRQNGLRPTEQRDLNAGVSDGREEYRWIGSIGADLYVLIGQRAISTWSEMRAGGWSFGELWMEIVGFG